MHNNFVLTFNGISFSDYQCFYDGSQLWRKPARLMESYSVAGRNGDVLIDQGSYSNITRPFNCFIRKDFIKNYNNLINKLSETIGYGRLETSEEPDVFYYASLESEIEPKTWQFNEKGTFTLNFNFKPQKWLKSGEIAIPINSAISIVNPTSQIAKPLIEVSGVGTITINGIELTLATNTSTTIIDCETENAYEGTINRNGDLTVNNGFPTLDLGENEISVSGCTINLIPRWWRL